MKQGFAKRGRQAVVGAAAMAGCTAELRCHDVLSCGCGLPPGKSKAAEGAWKGRAASQRPCTHLRVLRRAQALASRLRATQRSRWHGRRPGVIMLARRRRGTARSPHWRFALLQTAAAQNTAILTPYGSFVVLQHPLIDCANKTASRLALLLGQRGTVPEEAMLRGEGWGLRERVRERVSSVIGRKRLNGQSVDGQRGSAAGALGLQRRHLPPAVTFRLAVPISCSACSSQKADGCAQN